MGPPVDRAVFAGPGQENAPVRGGVGPEMLSPGGLNFLPEIIGTALEVVNRGVSWKLEAACDG